MSRDYSYYYQCDCGRSSLNRNYPVKLSRGHKRDLGQLFDGNGVIEYRYSWQESGVYSIKKIIYCVRCCKIEDYVNRNIR